MKCCGTDFYALCLYVFAYVMMTSAHCFLYMQERNLKLLHKNTTSYSIVSINDSSFYGLRDFTRSLVEHKNSLHISFMKQSTTRKISRASIKYTKDLVGITPSQCLAATSFHDNLFDSCNANYANVINSLIKLFNTISAAVISTSAGCYNTLAVATYTNLLKNAANNKVLTGIQNVAHYRTPEILSTENISAIIRDLKLQKVSLIVLLANTEIISHVFGVAKRFNIANYDTVWLTVELSHHVIQTEQVPWQVINVKQSDTAWGEIELNQTMGIVLEACKEFKVNSTTDYHQKLQELKNSLNHRLEAIQCKNDNQEIYIYARNSSDTRSLTWIDIFKFTKEGNMVVVSDASLLVRMLRISSSVTILRVATIIEPPFTMFASHLYNKINRKCDHGTLCRRAVAGWPNSASGKWEYSCCIGMTMDLLEVISADLHFCPDVYVVEDGFYGGYDKNTSEWNGLIRDIKDNKADLAVAALTPTADRFNAVDFCEPYLRIDLGVMISMLTSELDFINWEFLNPLDKELRIWMIMTFIIGTILIYLLENQHLAIQRILVKGVHPRYSWREGFSYFSGLTFQRDLGGKNPQKHGARVTAVAFAFGMVIIMTTYTAVLTASKVSQQTGNPFFGFKDDKIRVPTPDFKYATVSHTSIESFFKHSQDDVYKRMHHFMSQYDVNQTIDGIELVKAGVLQAFIHEYPVLEYHMSKEGGCHLKIYGDPIPQGGYAFSVPKHSPWERLISQSILKNKENEVIKNIYDKWFPSSCSQNSTKTIGFQKVEINYFGGLIFILGLSLLTSIALLGLEHFCHRHHRRVINPIQTKVLVWQESKTAMRRNALINPDDISRLQQLQLENQNDEAGSDSENSVISEREEELIRMRMMATQRQSRAHHISGTDTTSVNTGTSSDGSMITSSFFFQTTAVRAVEGVTRRSSSVSNNRLILKGPALMPTLETTEPGSGSDIDNDILSDDNIDAGYIKNKYSMSALQSEEITKELEKQNSDELETFCSGSEDSLINNQWDCIAKQNNIEVDSRKEKVTIEQHRKKHLPSLRNMMTEENLLSKEILKSIKPHSKNSVHEHSIDDDMMNEKNSILCVQDINESKETDSRSSKNESAEITIFDMGETERPKTITKDHHETNNDSTNRECNKDFDFPTSTAGSKQKSTDRNCNDITTSKENTRFGKNDNSKENYISKNNMVEKNDRKDYIHNNGFESSWININVDENEKYNTDIGSDHCNNSIDSKGHSNIREKSDKHIKNDNNSEFCATRKKKSENHSNKDNKSEFCSNNNKKSDIHSNTDNNSEVCTNSKKKSENHSNKDNKSELCSNNNKKSDIHSNTDNNSEVCTNSKKQKDNHSNKNYDSKGYSNIKEKDDDRSNKEKNSEVCSNSNKKNDNHSNKNYDGEECSNCKKNIDRYSNQGKDKNIKDQDNENTYYKEKVFDQSLQKHEALKRTENGVIIQIDKNDSIEHLSRHSMLLVNGNLTDEIV